MSRTRPALRPLAVAILAAFSLPALADSASNASKRDERTLEPVEVTGEAVKKVASPKFTAPLLDTPQTLSVIPSDVYLAQGAQNLTDVLRNTPGISFSAGENAFAVGTSNFNLRGFDTSGSIFVDGVRDSGNYGRDVFNLEQVEVAKGPAADYGRGGLSGYVNLVTKTPQLGHFVRGTASLGADEYASGARLRSTFDINQQVGETSALRLNLLLQDGGVPGRDHATSDALGIAPTLALGLGGDTQVILGIQHLKQDNRPDWGVPGAFLPGTVNYDAVAASAGRDNFYGLSSDTDESGSTTAFARIEHAFGNGATLRNQTRWSENDRSAAFTVPFGYNAAAAQVTGQTQFYRRDNSALSNQTDLSLAFSTGALEHQLAVGLEFSREEADALRFGTTTPAPADVLSPDPNRSSPAWPAPTQSASVKIDTLAAFVYDTVQFGERWQLSGGLRAESYDVELGSRVLASNAPNGPDGYEVDETTLGGKLGLVFKPAENASVYASVGVTTLPPGSYLANPDISRTGDNAFPGLNGQNNIDAKPQRAVNHEVGVKWDFNDGRLSTALALFNTERRSIGLAGKEPGVPSSPTTLRGYGKQVVQGVELSLAGRITDAWTIFAGAVFLDSERQHDAYLDAAVREANPNDYGSFLATNGDELAFTPKRSANLWTTYEFDNGFTLGGGVQHVGDSWAGRPDDADRIIPNGRFGKLPGYTVANLMAAYRVSEHWQVRLNVDNVADKTYAVSGNWPMTRVLLGSPRAVLLSASFSY